MPRPLILLTNDDGVKSPGLLSAARALRGLGEIIVVAPREQRSSQGRSFTWKSRRAHKRIIRIGQSNIVAYGVDASPAVSVRYGLMLAVPRRPSLVVSGINYGENLGSGLTISGTIGAALEAAAEGVPALAVSLQTEPKYHTSHSLEIDFAGAAYWTRFMASLILSRQISDVPLVNVNVPRAANRQTPWRVTFASRQAYFRSIVQAGRFVGYDVLVERESLEPESDIYALLVDEVVSITPLTYDLTAYSKLANLEQDMKRAANGSAK